MNISIRDILEIATLLSVLGRWVWGLRKRDLDEIKSSMLKIEASSAKTADSLYVLNGRVRTLEAWRVAHEEWKRQQIEDIKEEIRRLEDERE